MQTLPRRRCCLTVPGGSEKMLRKAIGLRADELVLDLEDAVTPDVKTTARRMVGDVIRSGGLAGRQVAVRINAIGTAWCHEDIVALAQLAQPGLTLVVPKIENTGDLAFIDRLLAGLEAGRPSAHAIGIQVLIETAVGLANCLARWLAARLSGRRA